MKQKTGGAVVQSNAIKHKEVNQYIKIKLGKFLVRFYRISMTFQTPPDFAITSFTSSYSSINVWRALLVGLYLILDIFTLPRTNKNKVKSKRFWIWAHHRVWLSDGILADSNQTSKRYMTNTMCLIIAVVGFVLFFLSHCRNQRQSVSIIYAFALVFIFRLSNAT